MISSLQILYFSFLPAKAVGDKRGRTEMKELWKKFDKTMLIMHQYDDIYPMFKSVVLVFEQKTPQIH